MDVKEEKLRIVEKLQQRVGECYATYILSRVALLRGEITDDRWNPDEAFVVCMDEAFEDVTYQVNSGYDVKTKNPATNTIKKMLKKE